MKKSTMLDIAISIAIYAHQNQFDKGGHPYILHVLYVMLRMDIKDEELMCIAVLHDSIEDNKQITVEYLRACGMSERIIEGVRCITKIKGEPYQMYKDRVFSNPDSIRVKMADLEHNMDTHRLSVITEKDMERVAGYREFYNELSHTMSHMIDLGGVAKLVETQQT